jgi:hypothetical protein
MSCLKASSLFCQFQKNSNGRRMRSKSCHLFELEYSGGRVEKRQRNFAAEYTADDKAQLYASLFNITRTRSFGDCDPEKICGGAYETTKQKNRLFDWKGTPSPLIRDHLIMQLAAPYTNIGRDGWDR